MKQKIRNLLENKLVDNFLIALIKSNNKTLSKRRLY